MPIKVAIIDDIAGNRNIMQHKLISHPSFKVCLCAADGREFINKMKELPANELPDVALMDLEMPEMDGVDTIALGSCLYPTVKFIVLTIFDDEEKIFKAIKAGAYGYLLKDESSEDITSMLLQMHNNGAGLISPGIAHKILQMVQNNELNFYKKPKPQVNNNDFFDLSEREKEILNLLVQGSSYKEIGASLFISANTAKKHVINIYNKLHVNSRAQAMHLAYEKGLF